MGELNYSLLPLVFTYKCYHTVAEFGEITVAIQAKNKSEADEKVKKFCKDNFLEERVSYLSSASLVPEDDSLVPEDDREFTDEELKAALKEVGKSVKEKHFSKGQPIAYLEGDKVIKEYPDGRKEVVIKVDT